MPPDSDPLDPRLPQFADAAGGWEPALPGRMSGRERLEHIRGMLVDLAAGRMTPGKAVSVEAVADGLAALLKDEDVSVAIDAAKMLGGLGPRAERIVPALAAAIDDDRAAPEGDYFPLWWWATNALEQIGVGLQPAVAPLARRLARADSTWEAGSKVYWIGRKWPPLFRGLIANAAVASGRARAALLRFLVLRGPDIRSDLEAARNDADPSIRLVVETVLNRLG